MKERVLRIFSFLFFVWVSIRYATVGIYRMKVRFRVYVVKIGMGQFSDPNGQSDTGSRDHIQ